MKKRVAMCRWFCDKVDGNPNFLDNLWFADETHFLLSGHVNSKNSIFWDSTPPKGCLQRLLHSIKCTAWVSISKHGTIEPHWFQDESEMSLMVNSQRYTEVLQRFSTTLGRRRGFEREGQWFQQNGGTPHTSNETLQWLRHRFGDLRGVKSSGHHNHQTQTIQIFISAIISKIRYMRTILRQSQN